MSTYFFQATNNSSKVTFIMFFNREFTLMHTYLTYFSYLLPLSFLSFFAPPFPFLCFCPGAAPFWSWYVWTLSMRVNRSSSGLMWLIDFLCSGWHKVSKWASLVAPLLGVDGLEWVRLGLARFDEQCLDFRSSFGTRFRFKDKGLPGTGLRGITKLSPGAPTVRKTSGNAPRCSMFLCPFGR